MDASSTDRWAATRKLFTDQFEQDGSGFIYRRSQKGAAIRVSAEERSRFIDEFNRNLRGGMWIMYIGIAVVPGGSVLFSILRRPDLSQAALFIGIGVVMIPYLFYNHWAWGAPARELAGRTPVAGERSPDEVRRLQFRRITYRQLGIAALAGLALPFFGSTRQDVFSGWNRLWLAFGGALVLFVAVQAFRKWRFDQDESLGTIIPSVSNPAFTDLSQDSASSQTNSQLWRYVPVVAILLGGPFIAFTPAGKQLAQTPSFWPILVIAFGSWSLITVVRGYSKGQIEPFARGFYNTYERETQPKRFWASMAWNGVLGCFCFWIAFMMSRDATAQPLQDRCYNERQKYQPQDVLLACNQLLAGKASLGGWSRADVFVDRAIAYDDLGRPKAALTDYTTAISLQPKYPEAHYDRALAYEQIGDVPRALNDYTSAIQQDPRDADFFFHRGLMYSNMRRWDAAIGDFTRSHELDPKNAWPLANRGLAYAWKSDAAHAKQDFAAVRGIDPQNRVMLHGEGLMYMFGGDLDAAVDRFSAAISHDPSDAWSLQMRADAYQQMGDFDKARRDRGELARVSGARRPRPLSNG